MYTKSLVAFLSLAVCCAASARAQTLEWVQQLDSGSSVRDEGRSVSTDGLGNVYIAGSTRGSLGGTNPNPGVNDAFLAKYDASGSLEWIQQLGTSDYDTAHSVSTDGLGNIYISGTAASGTTAGDALLAKYNDAGLLWTRQLVTDESEYAIVSADGLGNVYIAGSTRGSLGGPNAGAWDAYVAKYDASGTLQWIEQFGTSEWDWGQAVLADGLGNVYISGMTQGSLWGPFAGGDGDAFLAKYDANGTLLWTEQFGTSGYDSGNGVSADRQGNVYIVGRTGDNWDQRPEALLAKYDASGNHQWTEQLGIIDVAFMGEAVSADGLGNIYIAGTTSTIEDNSSDAFLAKYDTSGTLQWVEQYGTPLRDSGRGVSADGSGNVYISGSQGFNPNNNNSDAYLAKFVDLPPLQADFDGDGDVDGNDFLAWQVGFGDFPSGGAQKSDGDYDNDGDVDGDDFLGWQSEFGAGSGAASAVVPEPSSLALALFIASAGLVYRRSGFGRRLCACCGL